MDIIATVWIAASYVQLLRKTDASKSQTSTTNTIGTKGAHVADGRDVLALPTPRGATSRGSGVSHFAANNGFAGRC